MEILHIENLSFKYPGADSVAIDAVNLSIKLGSFNVICGESGCGKTTLLKLIKRELAPAGEKSGTIKFNGELIERLGCELAWEIGFVMQNPDNQIVTDKVWHELAFGLENMGVETNIIRRRVGEMASYFGIIEWFNQRTDRLSGGQKQLLNLASIMVMHPKILILDEPTGQLDPIAASDFISTLQKMNRELGLTIILAEHRLEEVFPVADRIIMMEKGRVIMNDAPSQIGRQLTGVSKDHPMLIGLPGAVRIFNLLSIDDICPLTVREGKEFISRNFTNNRKRDYVERAYEHSQLVAIELKDIWFRYERELPDIMRDFSLKIYTGEVFCILGGNGSGKTTALKIIAGINKAYRGKVIINGKKISDYKEKELYKENVALLPQNPQTVFLKNTIYEDLEEILKSTEIFENKRQEMIKEVANRLGIENLLSKHPYDLSGGEQQKCAIAKILLTKPKIILLDEPTKGLDAYSKQVLGYILADLKSQGITILIVTHDVEFAAKYADRCALVFDGQIISCDTKNRFFSDNNFYTTAANRISRHMYNGAVTCDQVAEMCKENGGINE